MPSKQFIEAHNKISELLLISNNLIDEVNALKEKVADDLQAFKVDIQQYTVEQMNIAQDADKKLEKQLNEFSLGLKSLSEDVNNNFTKVKEQIKHAVLCNENTISEFAKENNTCFGQLTDKINSTANDLQSSIKRIDTIINKHVLHL